MTKNTLKVYQSNALIKASYKLTPLQMRIIRYGSAQAREQNTGFSYKKPCLIKVQDFAEMYGHTDVKSLYQELKQSIQDLHRREVTIKESIKGSPEVKVTTCNWITERSYCDLLGYLHIVFNERTIPHFKELEANFTSYEVEQASGLNSVYAIRIFEHFKSEQWKRSDLGKHKCELTLEELREAFQLKDKYPSIKDFKLHVLDIAKSQINKHTPLTCSYVDIKEGRKITGFRFTFETKKQPDQKNKKSTNKLEPITNAYIEKHAQPGESYETARIRLQNLRDKKL